MPPLPRLVLMLLVGAVPTAIGAWLVVTAPAGGAPLDVRLSTVRVVGRAACAPITDDDGATMPVRQGDRVMVVGAGASVLDVVVLTGDAAGRVGHAPDRACLRPAED